ncbi:universal stress protein [Thermococcus sp. M39]|uniref:universal stress protein n=1 Tax=unclassified Thermococcus TaxID=2627626 RepID=UPI00143B93AF|nr:MULTISPECIES: universal stress protein [unclassified Thermococcus]NJE08117.1 universal stress protein [Thermococcus sp. M39]NJE11610.1 universal stress protein [Thermococcus sp. LS2]
MFEKILFPTDFSEVSLHALRNCVPKFFKLGVKKLYLVHVVDITATDIEALELMKIDAEQLDNLANELRERGVEVEPIVKLGIPSLEIAEIAKEKDVDLIISPSKGENILRQMFLGSTASNLVRAAKKPVLLIRYEWDEEEEKIKCLHDCEKIFDKPLVALDFSSCSIRIMETVKKFEELARKGVLLHVVDYGKAEELEDNIAKARQNLEKYTKIVKFPVEIEVLAGVASQGIIGVSITKNATLIVMGKKGRGIIKELLLGSTAERVIRDSKLPVLLVPCE